MKHGKTLLMAALLSMGTTAGVQAEEGDALVISGSLKAKWEHGKWPYEDYDINYQTLNLNFNYSFSRNLEAYLGFSYRNSNDDLYDDGNLSELDQYGIIFRPDARNVLIIGSQEAELGVLNGLVDLTDVGHDVMMQGVTWDYGAEDTAFSSRLFTGDTYGGALTMTGLQLDKPMGNITISGEYLNLKVNDDLSATLSCYGLGAAYASEKWGMAAEYIRSDADTGNTGYLAGVTYAFADDNELSLTYHHVNDSVTGSGLGSYEIGLKGFELEWEKRFSDRWTLIVRHDQSTEIDTDEDVNTSSVEVSYKF